MVRGGQRTEVVAGIGSGTECDRCHATSSYGHKFPRPVRSRVVGIKIWSRVSTFIGGCPLASCSLSVSVCSRIFLIHTSYCDDFILFPVLHDHAEE
jgi:hypothetical protein